MIEYEKAIRNLTGNYLEDFKILTSLGQVKGVDYLRIFGSNPETSTTQREVLDFFTAATKVYQGYFSTNTQLYLIGSESTDTTQNIIIKGIKEVSGDYEEAEETFALTGDVAVNIGSWLRINKLEVQTPHNILDGEVYVTTSQAVPTDSDNIIAAIKRNSLNEDKSNNVSKMCLYTVPKGKIALIEKNFISSISSKIGIFDVEIRPKGGDWISIANFTQDTSAQYLTNFEVIGEETDIKILSSYETTGGSTSASLHLYILEKIKLDS